MGDLNYIPIDTQDIISNYLEAFIQLDKSCFEENWNEENFLKQVSGKFNLSFLCIHQRELVGFLFGSYYAWNKQKVAHINRIATSTNHRNKNIGSKLIWNFEKKVRHLAMDIVTIEFNSRLNVSEFYIKNGFMPLKTNEIKSYLIAKQKLDKLELFKSFELNIWKKTLKRC